LINPVNNQYHEYTKIDTQAGKTLGNGQKFALDYKEGENADKAKESNKTEKNGVVVELSGQSAQQYADNNSREQAVNSANSMEQSPVFADAVTNAKQLWDKLSKTFIQLIQTIRESVLKFWNSDTETAQGAFVDKQEQKAAQDTFTADALPQDVAAFEASRTPKPNPDSADYVKEISDYLQQSDKGVYVKNSDLLTYYDRKGQIVKLSGSDRNRILKGDRSTMKG
jgi:hypothetical protein